MTDRRRREPALNLLASLVVASAALVVDHFGKAGAQVVIDYWESVLLTPRVRALLAEAGVRHVAAESDLLAALASAQVEPAVSHDEPADLLNVHRRDGKTDYYYLYNNGTEDVTRSVALSGSGTPFVLDAWTGVIQPIARYAKTDGGVSVDVSLAPGQATIVAVSKGDGLGAAPGESATGTTAEELVYDGTQLVVRDTAPGTYTTTLASGERVRSELGRVPDPIALNEWTLPVEAWGPGSSATETSKRRVADVRLDELGPWTAVDGLEGISGVATYITTVTFEEDWTGGHGAYLDLGESVDTVRVRVNGHSVGPVDLIDLVVDVGPYLAKGTNTIEVEVATSLINQLLKLRPDLAAGPPRRPGPGPGGGPGGGARRRRVAQPQGYGLLGPVVLQPYGQAAVRGR